MGGTRRCHRWSCTGGRWLFDKMLSDTLTPEPPEGSLMFSHVSAVWNTDVWCSFNHPHTQDRVQSNIQQGFRARAFPRLGLSDHMSPHTGEPGLLHTEHSHILYLKVLQRTISSPAAPIPPWRNSTVPSASGRHEDKTHLDTHFLNCCPLEDVSGH